ncbi:hypothetical protein KDA00_00990 [Candidatus Saccharibacteria bacterium]|nr:hypothetical protein [Candidatus Saccharibacteria bacterium]
MTTPDKRSDYIQAFGEMNRGVDPEVLDDMGYTVPAEHLPEVTNLGERRLSKDEADSKSRHPGFGGQLPIDLTEIADTPLGSVDEKLAERSRHPTARIVEPPVGEDPEDPVIIDWMKTRQRAAQRGEGARLTSSQQNKNERMAIRAHRAQVPKQRRGR